MEFRSISALSVSALERIKFGIRFLCRELRNSLKDCAVVDGRLAMSSKLGPTAVFREDVKTSWQLPQMVTAI